MFFCIESIAMYSFIYYALDQVFLTINNILRNLISSGSGFLRLNSIICAHFYFL
jgi:hypothetical protein